MLLFSHRYSVIDPYVGIQGSIPIQAGPAKDIGLKMPYYGGFLTGLEIIPWETGELLLVGNAVRRLLALASGSK